MAGIRTQARTLALQLLYQSEINPQDNREDGPFWHRPGAPPKARTYAAELAGATREHLAEIDARLEHNLEHWKLGRLSVVVRNVLRLAVCEMIVIGEVPFQVVINEAVELAREFMDEESAKFVNSVLEKCWLAAGREGAPPASLNGA